MNKANECTCPSGDGSLVHPCPAHPAVEQAGANVGHGHVLPRADGVKMRCGGPGLCSECTADASRARAALAQPSAAQAEQHWPKLEKPAQVGGVRFSAGVSSRLVVEAAQRLYEFESTPEQEAERIERLQAFREQCFEPLGAEFSKVLSDNLPELLSTAQAEQAEAERPIVSFEKYMQVMYDRDENAKRLDAALARVADMKTMADNYCALLMDANAKLAEMERQKEFGHVIVSMKGGYKCFEFDEYSHAHSFPEGEHQLYAAPVAQAQHSVPEISGIGRDAEHPRAVVLYLRNEPSDEDMRAIQNFLRAMLAAAPGKEVGHE